MTKGLGQLLIELMLIQCSPPNSNLWGVQTEFDLSDFLNYEISFIKVWLALKAFNMVLSVL